ncbi:helix-turn-helix transcriptional regulator [Bernardetia sp. ABR2-2B]|uniref:helix-turn-helix domain-containing protein n=1 Tax=Bernardetia sp. ABR2-2B TaxID=3127472 RepID=UPI0030D06434
MRVLRKKMKYSISEMSDLMGIGTTMVSNYERGSSEPNLTILIKVSEIFGLNVQDLIESTEIEILTKFENKNNSSNSQNNNIIDKSKNLKNVNQTQGGGVTNTTHTSSEKDEVVKLREEVVFLKEQLKFTQGLLQDALKK